MREDRPIGPPLPDFIAPPAPPREAFEGRWCAIEPFDPQRHAAAFIDACEGADAMWDYMFDGPFKDRASFMAWAERVAKGGDPMFFAIVDKADGKTKGVASYMRITPAHGVLEIGNIAYAPSLRNNRIGTEAMLLFMARAFALGYRRYEWKCNALNAPSRRLAMRLGLSFEGEFRRHMVVKGRNRDTAWYAVTEDEWPGLKSAHDAWLEPGNFDADGRQKLRLSELTRPCLVAVG
ncbi:MAG: GNAT family protein [Paracoccaceae bacterium]